MNGAAIFRRQRISRWERPEERGLWRWNADEVIQGYGSAYKIFNSGEYKKYKSATYTVRSYGSEKLDSYSDFNASRLTKIFKDTRYVNPIHEAIVPFDTPVKILPLIADHYGYIWEDNEEFARRKANRNLEHMLRIYEEKPGEPANILAISQAYLSVSDYENAGKYAKIGLEYLAGEKMTIKHSYYAELTASYMMARRYKQARELTKAYFRQKNEVLQPISKCTLSVVECLYFLGNYGLAAKPEKYSCAC